MKKKKEKPLTLSQLADFMGGYANEILLPAIDLRMDNKFKKHTDDVLLPATLKQLVNYSTDVLIPAIDSRIDARFSRFEHKMNDNFDKIFKDLEYLKEEKEISDFHDKQKRKFYGYVVRHMETGETSREELNQIKKLDILS